ncbi:uncharacterized protein LOC132746199 isoform X2 [Ruditapes philippinarum]|uniref:uncharacterized protein LOC132746199 isoform X2 n=1 Tax=Ruditapes philippinarum TaxID=129788 RepID=UPI00295C1E25|nr:uncharacterized protein LOC132746199 isoform X2 [Ruditapes philippinarum]
MEIFHSGIGSNFQIIYDAEPLVTFTIMICVVIDQFYWDDGICFEQLLWKQKFHVSCMSRSFSKTTVTMMTTLQSRLDIWFLALQKHTRKKIAPR